MQNSHILNLPQAHHSHKYRHGNAIYSLLRAKTMAQFKAISQNLMHDDIKITDKEYAWFNSKEIKKQLKKLKHRPSDPAKVENDLQTFFEKLSKEGLQDAITLAAKLLANS